MNTCCTKHRIKYPGKTLSVCLVIIFVTNVYAKPVYESPQLSVWLSPRTPQQIAAFYEARGFSQAMLAYIKPLCFITVRIRNKSQHVIWLDLKNWQFSDTSGTLQRFHRNDLKATWQNMNVPLAHQSTFRWTLLPEKLDFRPGETEGGNIVLPRHGKPVHLKATFMTHANKAGQAILVELDNINCANNPD